MTEYLPGIVEPNQEALQLATGFAFHRRPPVASRRLLAVR